MRARLTVINHASVLLEVEGVRLLTDPWFWGTAFSGGWELAHETEGALDLAARATHLWVSHFHSDHLHAGTLRALAKRAPDVEVLANVSHNFSMVERFEALGFRRVRALGERRPLELGSGVSVERVPTAGIDNMLVVRSPTGTAIDYNDCNLPAPALAALLGKVGPVDLLLTNYNHAGKLFEREPPGRVKARYLGAMKQVARLVAAEAVVPFASGHRYRSPFSLEQNASLGEREDLEALARGEEGVFVVGPGERVSLGEGGGAVERLLPARETSPSVLDYGESAALEELAPRVEARLGDLRRRFLGAPGVFPPLDVRLVDLDVIVRLRVGRRIEALSPSREADVRTHSRALELWHGRRFGDDTFFAGAHFDVERAETSAIRRWALATLLAGSDLDPRHLLFGLASASGLRFLWSRREEISATVLGGRLRAGDLRV